MNELIPLTKTLISDALVQTVNARELYEFLDSKRGFSKWIQERIEQYGFVENQDFTTLGNIAEQVHNKIEYHITLDMAKELAMVERNQKGKEARKYFIECERRVLSSNSPTNLLEALQLAVKLEEEKQQALQERDEAIKTKHFISDKKTASALGKLGAVVKKHSNFKNNRGCGETFATINEVSKTTETKYGFYPLKKWCEENDCERREVYLTNNTFTYAYPSQAWFEVYGLDLNDIFGEA